MPHPHQSFHPTPLRVERDQESFGIWKHTHVFPSRTAARVNGMALGTHPSRVAILLQLMQSQP